MDAEEVDDAQGFLAYLAGMRSELQNGVSNWENVDLPGFLEAMAAWVKDGRLAADANPWRHAANLLRAGAFYE
jgi:hypothetical protein